MKALALSERLRKETASLVRRKGREEAKQFLIEGVRSVEAAVAGKAQLVRVLINERLKQDLRISRLLEEVDAPVYVMTDKQEKTISTVETSSGCMGVARYLEDSLADIVPMNVVLVLDGIQDPGNAGTIIRTAAWFGIDAVLLGAGSVDLYNPKTVRSTMGGLWETRCVKVIETAEAIHRLKSSGFCIYGTFMEGVPLSQWQPAAKTGIVIGSESRGISTPIQALVDERISIPRGSAGLATESLNAATAGAICVYAYANSNQKTNRIE